MDGCKRSEWEVVLGAPDRVNIACVMHDTRLCQIYVKMTSTELKRCLYKTCRDVKNFDKVMVKV